MKNLLIKLLAIVLYLSTVSYTVDKVCNSELINDLPQTVADIIQNWETLKSECDYDDYKMCSWVPESGVRGKYYIVKYDLSIKIVEDMVGEKVFLSGPHGDHFNFSSHKSFGYYNPDFLNEIETIFEEYNQNNRFKSLAQKFYDENLKQMSRVYYLAYKYLENNNKIKQDVITEYQSAMTKSVQEIEQMWGLGYVLQEHFRTFAEDAENKGYDIYEAFVAPGFWIRRSIDDTDDEFFSLLTKVLEEYDAEFLKTN